MCRRPCAHILLAADPVVTSSEEVLRFEAFSACCSTYAHVDLLSGAIDGTLQGRGTTNVDFNAAMRAALARIRDADRVELSVGAKMVELAPGDEAVVERKVALPLRWLKGFVEVQAYQARMSPCLEVAGAEAWRFLAHCRAETSRRRAGSCRPGAACGSASALRPTASVSAACSGCASSKTWPGTPAVCSSSPSRPARPAPGCSTWTMLGSISS